METPPDRALEARYRYWINTEIPRWLDKFPDYESFDKAMPEACASGLWKVIVYGMAKERWKVSKVTRIPS